MEMNFALGLMSGTSLDGIDAALIRTDGKTVREFGPWITVPYETEMGRALRHLIDAGQGGDEAEQGMAQVEAALTEAHAAVVGTVLAEAGLRAAQIRVVGFHGHTLWHDPEHGRTRQIGDGALLAERLGIDVVNDFRSADMAAGGQGAPLAPLYHAALVQSLASSLELPVAVLNLGGVANITWIGQQQRLLAFDTGPASALIDDLMLRRCGEAFDRDGERAAAGQVDDGALAILLDNA